MAPSQLLLSAIKHRWITAHAHLDFIQETQQNRDAQSSLPIRTALSRSNMDCIETVCEASNLNIPMGIKRHYCQECGTLFIPGLTSRHRLVSAFERDPCPPSSNQNDSKWVKKMERTRLKKLKKKNKWLLSIKDKKERNENEHAPYSQSLYENRKLSTAKSVNLASQGVNNNRLLIQPSDKESPIYLSYMRVECLVCKTKTWMPGITLDSSKQPSHKPIVQQQEYPIEATSKIPPSPLVKTQSTSSSINKKKSKKHDLKGLLAKSKQVENDKKNSGFKLEDFLNSL